MNKALLVEIHILCAQKWAGGHTVPSRYGCVHEHLQLYKRNNYICKCNNLCIYTNTPVVVCCHNNESAVFFGSIFYINNVVGGVVYSKHDIYGARTHSARRYNAFKCIYN